MGKILIQLASNSLHRENDFIMGEMVEKSWPTFLMFSQFFGWQRVHLQDLL